LAAWTPKGPRRDRAWGRGLSTALLACGWRFILCILNFGVGCVVFEGSGGAFCGRPSNARGCVNSEAKLLRAGAQQSSHSYFFWQCSACLCRAKSGLGSCFSDVQGGRRQQRYPQEHVSASTQRILAISSPRAALLYPLYSLSSHFIF